jgi:mannose-6-phosphate isomerase-like protein (cupin superfamily)
MRRYFVLALGLAFLSLAVLAAQTRAAQIQATPAAEAKVITGDKTSPLSPVKDSPGVNNAVLRDQPDVRVLRIVMEPGSTRVMHSHDDVKFNLVVPISGPLTLRFKDGPPVIVPAWGAYYLKGGVVHDFYNPGKSQLEILEMFAR